MLRLGRPREEDGHIFSHLRGRRGRAVVIVDCAIVERRRHADPATRKVRVVVLRLARRDARGHILVARQQRENVVSAAVASLDDQRQVRRIRAVVGKARGLLVGVGRGHVVGGLARALEVLALVVGAVLDVNALGHRLDLRLRVANAHQVAVCDEREAVARGAHLRVHLVAAADAASTASAEQVSGACHVQSQAAGRGGNTL